MYNLLIFNEQSIHFSAPAVSQADADGEHVETLPYVACSNATAKVYTDIVPDCRKTTLQAIIRGRVSLDSVIYSDGWRGYDELVDVGYGKHFVGYC